MSATVVLATKVYVAGDARDRALRSLRGLIEDRCSDLDVDLDLELGDDEFPVVTLSGDDETVAANLLAEEFGEIHDELVDGETYVGTLESWDDEGFVLDAGQPVRIGADQIGLGPGTPEQVRERFGLVQHLPMQFVYGDEPELAEAERDRCYDWQRDEGRVTVNSATRSEVRATINRAGHAQDIVTVERLGLLEHSVVCREGTDPPGLIASVGEYLPAELRAVV